MTQERIRDERKPAWGGSPLEGIVEVAAPETADALSSIDEALNKADQAQARLRNTKKGWGKTQLRTRRPCGC